MEIQADYLKDKYKERMKVHGLFFGFFLVPALGFTFLSPMMFDAPGSDTPIALITFFYAPIAYLIVTTISIPLSWIVFHYQKHTVALYISLAPLLVVIPFLILLLFKP